MRLLILASALALTSPAAATAADEAVFSVGFGQPVASNNVDFEDATRAFSAEVDRMNGELQNAFSERQRKIIVARFQPRVDAYAALVAQKAVAEGQDALAERMSARVRSLPETLAEYARNAQFVRETASVRSSSRAFVNHQNSVQP